MTISQTEGTWMKNDVILRPDRTRSIGAVYATEIGSHWCICGGQVVCVILLNVHVYVHRE